MKKTLKELTQFVGGEVIGDENILITGLSSIDAAREGEITFLSHPKYLSRLIESRASAVIAAQKIEGLKKSFLITPNPYLAFAKIVQLFCQEPRQPKGIDKDAVIGKGVILGNDVSIYPLVYVGDNVRIGDKVTIYPGTFIDERVTIGKDTLIYPNVSIYKQCQIGERVIIHAGSVIGSDGFGFAKDGEKYCKIPPGGHS